MLNENKAFAPHYIANGVGLRIMVHFLRTPTESVRIEIWLNKLSAECDMKLSVFCKTDRNQFSTGAHFATCLFMRPFFPFHG